MNGVPAARAPFSAIWSPARSASSTSSVGSRNVMASVERGGELGDLAQGGRVGVFGEGHGDVGLNRHESRHSVARLIFHGNEGQLRQPYRDQLGALGFALNALVLWNAQYLDDAIAQLRATGHQITDEDLRRLSPLQHEHIKMLGRTCGAERLPDPAELERRATPPVATSRRRGCQDRVSRSHVLAPRRARFPQRSRRAPRVGRLRG
jgi:hypothetical protein